MQMETDLIASKFEAMGARVKFNTPPRHVWGLREEPNEDAVTLDIRRDRKGEYFDIRAGANIGLNVIDLRPGERHLLLMSRSKEGKSKFLCGHDERHWFVAAVPEAASASNVSTAMDALKPPEVLEAQERKRIKHKARNLRKTNASIRQGEWFFIPAPHLKVDDHLVLKDEPLVRGGKPHVAEYLYRRGGETVYVSGDYPDGLTQEQFTDLKHQPTGQAGWLGRFRTMRRNAQVFVKGTITHPDHKTIRLTTWHEVKPNTETQAKAMRHVAFLD